jgi:hypothetical protein
MSDVAVTAQPPTALVTGATLGWGRKSPADQARALLDAAHRFEGSDRA